jgi:hypothetical protein
VFVNNAINVVLTNIQKSLGEKHLFCLLEVKGGLVAAIVGAETSFFPPEKF